MAPLTAHVFPLHGPLVFRLSAVPPSADFSHEMVLNAAAVSPPVLGLGDTAGC